MLQLPKSKLNKFLPIALAFLISFPSLVGLLSSGFFLSDDGNWMVIRFSAFYEALRNGQFPVRFLPRLNNGYGYPVSDFLYPLFMYIGVPIKALGFSFVDTIKVILSLSMVGSAIFTYLWLSKLFGRLSSFFGTFIYVYTPYHLFDLYKRGSVGEILTLAIAPFIFWQIEKKSFFWITIGTAALIVSHNTLAVLLLLLIALYIGLNILISSDKKQLIYQYIGILVLALGLSSFFWMPAIFDLQYTVFSGISVSDFSEYFANKELIGFSTLFIFILVFTLFLSKKIIISKHRLTLLFFIAGLISLFFATSLTLPFWNLLPVSFIQFPFRFLSITILCVSFLSASLLSVLSKRQKIIVCFVIILFALFSTKDFIFPKTFQYYPDSFYSTNQDTTTVKNEYMPKWVRDPLKGYAEKAEIIKGDGVIENLKVLGTNISFETVLRRESTIQINSVYFPGWEVHAGGKNKEVLYEQNGLIRFGLPSGTHFIEASFRETNVRLISDLISVFSLICLILIFIRKKTI